MHDQHSGHTHDPAHRHPRREHSVPLTHVQGHANPDEGTTQAPSPFPELMAEVMSGAERFAHRQHVHLTYLAVRRYGTATAIDVVSNGIQEAARYARAPQKYNATISRAWVELIGHHADHSDAAGFDTFAERNPALLDKKLLTRFYRPATLAGTQARTGWVTPDLSPFPWNATAA